MKKLLALLLAVMMVLLSAACSHQEEKTDTKQTVSGEKETQIVEEATVYVPKGFSLGEINGQTYENTFVKIGCRLPEGWEYRPLKELGEEVGIHWSLEGDALVQSFLEKEVFLVMAASRGQSRCIIALEKMDNEKLDTLDITMHDQEEIQAIEESFAKLEGVQDPVMELGTVMLDGKTFDCIHGSMTRNGEEMVLYSITIKCDGYLATLVLTICDEENQKEFLDCFYLLK